MTIGNNDDIQFPFTSIGLTAAVNLIPPQWGRITQMGLFASESVSTRLVEISRREGKLVILSHEEPGQHPNVADGEGEDSFIVKIPHFPYDDTIKPQDLQGMLAVMGRQRAPKSMSSEMEKRLRRIRRTHDITLEFMRMGALKGNIVDGKGRTLHNLFDVFDVTRKEVDFELGTTGTDVYGKCTEVTNHIEDHLSEDTMDGVTVEVSPEFFTKLVKHENVEKFYLQHQGALALTDDQIRKRGFPFNGLIFREYRATAKGIDGQTHRFIAANDGHAYPVGTAETFKGFNAPPHHINFVNEMTEEEIFISTKVLDHGEGVELRTQSNHLPICTKPEVLVRCHTSN